MNKEWSGLVLAAEGSQPAANNGGNQFILILYVFIILYFIYQLYKGYKARKLLEKPFHSFPRASKKAALGMFGFMSMVGVINLITKQYVSGLIMIVLGVLFLFLLSDKIYLAPNGLYGENEFIPWGSVRKWSWDREKGVLYLLVKERGSQGEQRTLQVGTKNMAEVNQLIRHYKLGK